MKKYQLQIVALAVTALSVSASYAKPPVNLTCAKQAIIQYYNSDNYLKDVNEVVADAEKYLKTRVQENQLAAHPQKLAMILDIDDTSLSNFVYKKKYDFSNLPDTIDESYRDANAPAIEPTLRLYNEAIQSGVAIFFVSFRPDEMRSYTITNLQKAGYYGWSNLYLPNSDEIKSPSQVFKTAVRKMITEQGYDIILNLGDQDSDLEGGYAEHTDKIPNPLYTSPGKCTASFCGT